MSCPAKSPLEAFLEWHDESPEDVAVECLAEHDGRPSSLSVDQVYTRAARLASVLLHQPLSESNDVVGIFLELESELYIAFIACWMAQRTPTVLSSTWTPAVLDKIIRRLKIHTILYTRLEPPALNDVTNLRLWDGYRDVDVVDRPMMPEPYYAVINPSSGTTGVPKSIPVRMAMYAQYCPEVTKMTPKRLRTAFVAAPAYSGVTAGIYLAPYTRGICVYAGVAKDGLRGYGAAEIADNALQMVQDSIIDAIGFTPSLFAVFDSMLRSCAAFPGTTCITFGGEKISPDTIRAARCRFPNATITVRYSSTESVQAGFSAEYRPDMSIAHLQEIVLAPNSNVQQLILLNDEDKPVGLVDGAIGRVAVITGASADPYLLDDEPANSAQCEKTEASIVDTFRWSADHKRMIVFGDRAMYRSHARGVVVLGRDGRRVKRNGVFVDLNVLDTIIARYLHQIEHVCVVAVASILVCLYTTKQARETALTVSAVNNALSHELDSVQVNITKRIESVPVAKSGKRDWSKLQDLAGSAADEELANFPQLDQDDKLGLQVSLAVAKIFGRPGLAGRNVALARIGLDSISAVRLVNALRPLESAQAISQEHLLQSDASVLTIARHLSSEKRSEQNMSKAFLNTEVERLLPRVRTLHGVSHHARPPQSIVLTGATGYLGAYILAELLIQYPQAKLWCIVRSGGMPRVIRALRRTKIDFHDDLISSNVRIMHGDLGQPRLGLNDSGLRHISTADLIIHNGAVVHWSRPYESLLGPNIESLLFLLELAPASSQLIFVSGGGQTALDEDISEAFDSANGYTATKYVAERLCERAGTGVRIVRPGFIIGQPVCNADDFLWRLVRTAIELGICVASAPGSPSMNAAPVRTVAQRVLHPRSALDRIWVECSIDDIWSTLKNEGYTLRKVQQSEWIDALRDDLAKRGQDHPLFTLTSFSYEVGSGLGYPRPKYLPLETLDRLNLAECIRSLRETGGIPEPDGTWGIARTT